jgi:hypothetical protein
MLQGAYWQTDWNYDVALDVSRPGGSVVSSANKLAIPVGSSLLSSASYADVPYDPNHGGCRVQYIEILTVLAAAPPAGSFRPSYCGSDKRIPANVADLRANLLPTYTAPTSVPSAAGVAGYFLRPWIEHMPGWLGKEQSLPTGNMPNYGREVTAEVSEGAALLLLDIDSAEKDAIALRMTQLGIDNYGCTLVAGGLTNWKADGGHMPGRGFPILLAGFLLNNSAMLNVMSKSGIYAYSGTWPQIPDDYLHFGEQDQSFYVTQHEVDMTHSTSWDPDTRVTSIPYETTDIGQPSWGISHVSHPEWDNKYINANYRSVNQPNWVGWVVASLVLRLEPYWNNDAIFDSVAQWMTDPNAETQPPGRTVFNQAMYDTYRSERIPEWDH